MSDHTDRLIETNHVLLADAEAMRQQTWRIIGRTEVTRLQARIMAERTLAMTSRLGSWEQFVAGFNCRDHTGGDPTAAPIAYSRELRAIAAEARETAREAMARAEDTVRDTMRAQIMWPCWHDTPSRACSSPIEKSQFSPR